MWMVMFIAGWNDSSQGPLLPLLQEYYSVSLLLKDVLWLGLLTGDRYGTQSVSHQVFMRDLGGLELEAESQSP